MSNLGLIERLKIYLKYLGRYSLGFGLYCLVVAITLFSVKSTNLKEELNKDVAIIGLTIFLLFILGTPIYLGLKVHLKIAKNFIPRRSKKVILLAVPVFAVWLSLLAFKVYVNEEIYTGHLIDQLPDIQRFFHYFSFALWTTIFWWEIYYYFISKVLKREV